MYTQASGSALVYYLLPTTVLTAHGQTCAYTIQYIRQGGYVPVTCTLYLYAVRCTWYGYTYDDDEDDDMTRCRIHRDAALREAKEREKREGGLGRGENWHGGDEGGEISPVRRTGFLLLTVSFYLFLMTARRGRLL